MSKCGSVCRKATRSQFPLRMYNAPMPPEALFPWTAAALAAAALAAVASVLSLFLLVKTLAGGRLPGCGPGSACDAVTTSRWARWWRIPVAMPATLLYVSIATLAVLDQFGLHFRNILASLSILAIATVTWFIFAQAFL